MMMSVDMQRSRRASSPCRTNFFVVRRAISERALCNRLLKAFHAITDEHLGRAGARFDPGVYFQRTCKSSKESSPGRTKYSSVKVHHGLD